MPRVCVNCRKIIERDLKKYGPFIYKNPTAFIKCIMYVLGLLRERLFEKADIYIYQEDRKKHTLERNDKPILKRKKAKQKLEGEEETRRERERERTGEE